MNSNVNLIVDTRELAVFVLKLVCLWEFLRVSQWNNELMFNSSRLQLKRLFTYIKLWMHGCSSNVFCLRRVGVSSPDTVHLTSSGASEFVSGCFCVYNTNWQDLPVCMGVQCCARFCRTVLLPAPAPSSERCCLRAGWKGRTFENNISMWEGLESRMCLV